MAEKRLSPRQRMINMMYLVLTALLALNVSKEVLRSFFEVNTGIERTTTNFNLKNNETYAAFENAASEFPEKYQEVRDKAFSVQHSANNLSFMLQSMKYDLVSQADKGIVVLGNPKFALNDKGKLNKDEVHITIIENKKFDELDPGLQKKQIAYLNNKKDRSASEKMFLYPKTDTLKQRAYILSNSIHEYKKLLVSLANGNQTLVTSIEQACDISDKKRKGKDEPWEEFNFLDMPSVGALTILSKIQSDMRNIESDVIDYLKRHIEDKLLKFEEAQATVIPEKLLVLRGDSFKSEIFLAAKQSIDPVIMVGSYDTLSNGQFEMHSGYETVRISNGKGIYATKTSSEGNKKWGGLIAMKSEQGTKYYPFGGEYLVASVEPVVAPDWMDKLYLEMNNPITVSVPGYPASDVVPKCRNCSEKPKIINKKLGQWSVRPSKQFSKATPMIDLYVNEDGRLRKMGTEDFRVVQLKDPNILIARSSGGEITASKLIKAGKIFAKPSDPDIPKDAIKYKVLSFDWKPAKGLAMKNEDAKFANNLKQEIGMMKSGETIIFRKIVYIQTDCATCEKLTSKQTLAFDIK